jgi:hypothetical protein
MMAESFIRIHELDDINLSNNTFLVGSENNAAGRFTVESLRNFISTITGSITLNQVTSNEITFGKGADLIVTANQITVTHSRHLVDTFNLATNADLHSIFGTLDTNSVLLLSPLNASRSITIKHSIGNIYTQSGTDILLSNDKSYALLYNVGSSQNPIWHVIATNVAQVAIESGEDFVEPIEPTLSLDFSKRIYRQLSAIDESIVSSFINDILTIDRNSLGAYQLSGGKLQFAPVDKVGYCYFPKDTNSGIPIYSETTNLLLHSEDFENASWIKTGIQQVTNNFDIAPDGTNTLNFILPSTTTSQHSIRRNITTVVGQVYTTSIYAKTSTSNYQLRIRHGSGAGGDFMSDVNFNLSNGNRTRGDVNGRSFEIPYLGFYRFTLPFVATSTTTRVEFAIHGDATTAAWLPNGTSGILLWGAQTNDGRMTGYTKSTGTAGVSNLTDIQIPLTESWYQDSSTKWTLYLEYYLPELTETLFTSANYRRHLFDIGSDSATRLLVYSSITSGTPRICFVHTGTGVTTQTIANTSVPISELNKVCKLALSWDGANLLLGYNGQVSTVAINEPLISNTYNRIKIGQQTGSTSRGMNGKAIKLSHYPKAFNAAELVGVTTL